MTHKLGKFSTLTLGVLAVTGSFAIAAGPQDQKSSQSSQTKSGYSSQQQEQSGSQKSQMQSSGTPVMGSRASTVVFATVNEVNKEQDTVTLQASDGSMMEMDVPEEALSNLQQGDIVEVTVDKLTAVTIDKVHDAQQSAMSGKTQGSQQSSQQGSQQSSASGTSAQGSQSPTATPATVESIDSQQGKITLRMEKSGKTVDMQVPEELLSDLESGDSVQVSIRKSQQSQSGGSQSPSSKSQSR